MRKLKTFNKLLFFPAACFACIVWTVVFVVLGTQLQHPNLGLDLMLVFGGLTLLLPWLVVAFAMGRRIDWNHDLTRNASVEADGIHRMG